MLARSLARSPIQTYWETIQMNNPRLDTAIIRNIAQSIRASELFNHSLDGMIQVIIDTSLRIDGTFDQAESDPKTFKIEDWKDPDRPALKPPTETIEELKSKFETVPPIEPIEPPIEQTVPPTEPQPESFQTSATGIDPETQKILDMYKDK